MATPELLAEKIAGQLSRWPELRERVEALPERLMRKMTLGDGRIVMVVHNPDRRRSSGADLSAAALAVRPCFLCDANRPAEQEVIDSDDKYNVLVNPYPVGWPHLTIVAKGHQPQSIPGRAAEMIEWMKRLEGLAVFYNGPGCGASCPDHLHFQAINPDMIPLFGWEPVRGGFSRIVSDSAEGAAMQLERMLSGFEGEPPVNIVGRYDGSRYEIFIAARSKLRPDCYSADAADAEKYMVSPASLEMAGCIVTPLLKDFERISPKVIEDILSEVSAPIPAPLISVGVITAPEVEFRLSGPFTETVLEESGCMTYEPQSPESTFSLRDVTIGVNFHWQRQQTQHFSGKLQLLRRGSLTTAINIIDVESYLRSVISSEMSAYAGLQFLKAHAVISRSWVLAQLAGTGRNKAVGGEELSGEVIRWYDRDDHADFDFCADDHCQRYQGLGREHAGGNAIEAVTQTLGEVLVDGDGMICDARFSKCCGGMMEVFSSCWEPVDRSYLQAVRDIDSREAAIPDLTDEAESRRWIEERPESFCRTIAPEVLRQVMNDFDLETTDFYRWEQHYGSTELSSVIAEKSGYDFGRILDLKPLERGRSGRIVRLLIVGEKRSMVVGKELEIRRWLSRSHLKSSAFIVDRDAEGGFLLRGAGWGHGVGLCQIGAANMGELGYDYRQILSHYYPGSHVERRY